jgi:8-oxo-dGTP pyrophosphatase MutT (NUDIX family)
MSEQGDAGGVPARAVGAVVLLRDDGAALLQHRDEKPGLRHAGAWVMPGGHCEPGETIESCARREFREETDYDCDELTFLSSFVDEEDAGCRCTMFWGRYDGRQAVHCHEGQALRFVMRQEASSYQIPDYLVALWDMALTAAAQAREGSFR